MVEVARLDNNTMIVLRIRDNIKSKVFYSNIPKEKLKDIIEAKYNSDGKNKINLNVIKDNETSKCIHIKSDLSVAELRDDIYKTLLKEQIIQDAKLHIKRLKIINLMTREYDSKQISFNSKESLDDLFKFFEKIVNQIIKEEDDKGIYFVDEDQNKKTHQWSIHDGKKMKSQQIKLDAVSSKDLMTMILSKIKRLQ